MKILDVSNNIKIMCVWELGVFCIILIIFYIFILVLKYVLSILDLE